jgi:hypothetical protein
VPRPHRLLAVGLAAASFLATAWFVPGCGSEPKFEASVDYTPNSLAEELVFRTKGLSPSARKAEKKRSAPARSKAAPGFVPEPETKGQSKTQTKKAEVQTLDDVLDDIEGKARRIQSVPAAEVFRQMADAVSKDSTLDANDRDTLVKKLDEMAATPE